MPGIMFYDVMHDLTMIMTDLRRTVMLDKTFFH